DWRAEEDDALLQEHGVDVVDTLATRSRLYDGRYYRLNPFKARCLQVWLHLVSCCVRRLVLLGFLPGGGPPPFRGCLLFFGLTGDFHQPGQRLPGVQRAAERVLGLVRAKELADHIALLPGR